jgi:hypothetical protein
MGKPARSLPLSTGRVASTWNFAFLVGGVAMTAAHSPKEIVDAVRVLARICSDDAIAGALSRSGLLTGRGNRWTRERVTSLRSYHDIPAYSTDRRRAEGWLTLTEADDHLQMSGVTLRLAIDRGEIEAEHPLANGPWVINRSALETATALQFAERS